MVNGSFSEGALGKMPMGWEIAPPILKSGFRGELVEEASLPGKRAILFAHETGYGPLGNFVQEISAKLLRGKRIRFTSRLRLEAAGPAGAMLWVKVGRSDNQTGFFDNMYLRPVTQSTWTVAEIIGDVAQDADRISLGAILNADRGKMWVAPFTLEVLGDTPKLPVEAARPLTPQGLRNMVAFTKAFNYVRFFHPSDQAADTNWNRLAIQGVRAVEGAANTAELARRLRTFFGPYAPGARFLLNHEKAEPAVQPATATQLVRWEHVGYWNKDLRAPYHSQRVFIPLTEGQEKGWSTPGMASRLPLTRGLTLSLPTVCFADANQATLPKPSPAVPRAEALPEPTAEGNLSMDDRATRLGSIGLAWGVFQHFYPYFDIIGADWEADLNRALQSAATDAGGPAFSRTLRRLVAALKDGHSQVQGEGEFGQYGPSLGVTLVGDQPIVGFAFGSAKAVLPGSRILSVEGEPVVAVLARLREELSAATPGWMNARLAALLLSGRQGSMANLRIQGPSGQETELCLPRDARISMLKDSRLPAPFAEPQPGVYYVDLDRITQKAFQDSLPQLARAKGVVFDLRGYPKVSPDILGHLAVKPVDDGKGRWGVPMVTQPDRVGWTWQTQAAHVVPPAEPRITGKVVFLAGGRTLSMAETWMDVVKANHLGEIVGETTGGTNGATNKIYLPGNYVVVWSGVRAIRGDGRQHHGIGIQPTVPVSPTLKGLTEGLDEVLAKGLEIVSH